MKWKREPAEFLSEKTFLIIRDDFGGCEASNGGKEKNNLSSIVSNSNSSSNNSSRGRSTDEESDSSQTRSPMGKTSTWPPKMKRSAQPLYEELDRPKTANLDKPSVLNPELVDKLDMSLLSKELFCDSITRYQQLTAKTISGGNSSTTELFPSNRCRRRQTLLLGLQQQQQHHQRATWNDRVVLRHKRCSFEQILDASLSQIEPALDTARMQKQSRLAIVQDNQNANLGKRSSPESKKFDDNNNRNSSNGPNKVSTLSSVKKKSSRASMPADVEVFTSLTSKNVPEPCRTCGRSDQPERFHSHPKDGRPNKTKNSLSMYTSKTKVSVPKTVQKPVALNFRSDKNRIKTDEEAVTARDVKTKSITPAETRSSQQTRFSTRPSSAPIKRGPKTVTCYICGREFGTTSFPIHEPRCLQKWEQENNSLPVSQRRPTPRRPEVAIDQSEWNTAAWEKSQAQLVPCPKCGRTFLPDRLLIHRNNCKAIPKNPEKEKVDVSEKSTTGSSRNGPPMIPCQICGRNFGTRSIKIHEPQCTKRWQIEKETQSLNSQRRESSSGQKSSPSQDNASISPLGDISQKRTITCYICGRDFGSSSIAIHEPQCLKKWHVENDKLPPSQRRKEPQKPDVIYTKDPATGDVVVDLAAIAEASWKTHLSQLVPCKNCGRTFNPDRVIVHERSCKGNR
ncbi:hypothetical protein KPH14_005743 [Odynerus spinipes]|uniref:C2HC/C3H-type domain-containing protein n=1 Tax=Odynerus spinipes TaxID=1348599 RepID=A0AAD9RB56_9HYME|nr:hypothetical protein KPH14_005743 [Odynerus spinipes]